MEISREEIAEIAKATAQHVLENLHRYTVEYKEPATIEQGLRDSMIEEKTAEDWYKKRAKHARDLKDEITARKYEHIAGEEHRHWQELNEQRDIVGGQYGSSPT